MAVRLLSLLLLHRMALAAIPSSVALGVDMGDKVSVVAALHRAGIEVLTNTVGGRSTPSAVVFGERERFVGEQTAGGMVAKHPHKALTRPRWKLLQKRSESDILVNLPGDTQPTALTTVAQTVPLLTHMCLAAWHALREKKIWESPGALVVSVPSYLSGAHRRSVRNILASAFGTGAANGPLVRAKDDGSIDEYGRGDTDSSSSTFFADMMDIGDSSVREEAFEGVEGAEEASDPFFTEPLGLITDGSALALAYGFSRRAELAREVGPKEVTTKKSTTSPRDFMFSHHFVSDGYMAQYHSLAASVVSRKARVVAFVDIGHSSLQVTIAAFTGDGCEILAQVSDTRVSGAVIEEILFRHVVKKLVSSKQITEDDDSATRALFPACLVRPLAPAIRVDDQEEPQNPEDSDRIDDTGQGEWRNRLTRAGHRLLEACARAKNTLSANTEAMLSVDCLVADNDVRCELQRPDFEELCVESQLPERVTGCCRRAFAAAAEVVARCDQGGCRQSSPARNKSTAITAGADVLAKAGTQLNGSSVGTGPAPPPPLLSLHSVELVGGTSYVPLLRAAVQKALQSGEKEGGGIAGIVCDGGVRQTLDAFETVAKGCALRAAQVMMRREELEKVRSERRRRLLKKNKWFDVGKKHDTDNSKKSDIEQQKAASNSKIAPAPAVVRSKIRIPPYVLAERNMRPILFKIFYATPSKITENGTGLFYNDTKELQEWILPAGSLRADEPLQIHIPLISHPVEGHGKVIDGESPWIVIDAHELPESAEWPYPRGFVSDSWKTLSSDDKRKMNINVDMPIEGAPMAKENESWWIGLKKRKKSSSENTEETLNVSSFLATVASTSPLDDESFLARFLLRPCPTDTQLPALGQFSIAGDGSMLSFRITVSSERKVSIAAAEMLWDTRRTEVSASVHDERTNENAAKNESDGVSSPEAEHFNGSKVQTLPEPKMLPLSVCTAAAAELHSHCSPFFDSNLLETARDREIRQRHADELAVVAAQELNTVENLLYQGKEILDDTNAENGNSGLTTDWAPFMRVSEESFERNNTFRTPLPKLGAFMSPSERQQFLEVLRVAEDWLESAPLSNKDHKTEDILLDAIARRRALDMSDNTSVLATALMRQVSFREATLALDMLFSTLANFRIVNLISKNESAFATAALKDQREQEFSRLQKWIMGSLLSESKLVELGKLYMSCDQVNRIADEAAAETENLRNFEKHLLDLSEINSSSGSDSNSNNFNEKVHHKSADESSRDDCNDKDEAEAEAAANQQ